MAITAAFCNSFKQELFDGTHQAGDDYKIALFTSAATLNKSTTAYSTTNEVSGTGYSAGGQSLASRSVSLDGDTAIVDWGTDPSWPNSTITARGALIYNATRSNKACAVLDFGTDVVSSNGTFTVALPAPSAAAAVLRIA